jgi:hypothetical protein
LQVQFTLTPCVDGRHRCRSSINTLQDKMRPVGDIRGITGKEQIQVLLVIFIPVLLDSQFIPCLSGGPRRNLVKRLHTRGGDEILAVAQVGHRVIVCCERDDRSDQWSSCSIGLFLDTTPTVILGTRRSNPNCQRNETNHMLDRSG